MLCNGRVCDPEERAADRNLKALHDLTVLIYNDPAVEMRFLPIADGLTVVRKK